MLRLARPLMLAVGLASPACAQSALTPRAPAHLIHGNYCGPGNNAPLPPIDALDAACARHDACTPVGGLPTPACNANLARAAQTVAQDPRQSQELRSIAGLVALGATMIPAEDRDVASTASVPRTPRTRTHGSHR